MSLSYGLLGLLEYSSKTGYDLAKLFGETINKFWHAHSSQIYRELNRMEEKGWVVSESVIQEGKPNKRLYSITEEGQAVFNEWMNTPAPLFENPHQPLLMYTFFGASSPEATLKRLKEVRDGCILYLEDNAKKTQEAINYYKPLNPEGEKRSPFWQMTLEFGVAKNKAFLQWAEEWIEKLEADMKGMDDNV